MSDHNHARASDEEMRSILGDELFDKLTGSKPKLSNAFDETLAGLGEVTAEIADEAAALASIDPLEFQSIRSQMTAYLSSLRPGYRIAILTALLFDGYAEGGIGQPLTDLALTKLVRTLNEQAAENTGIPVEHFLTASVKRLLEGVAEVRTNIAG